MFENEKQLVINGIMPAAASDGHRLTINNETGETDLLFFQVNPQSDMDDSATLNAAAISHLRLSVGELEELKNNISNALEVHHKNRH